MCDFILVYKSLIILFTAEFKNFLKIDCILKQINLLFLVGMAFLFAKKVNKHGWFN
jgi:hypothetical protein